MENVPKNFFVTWCSLMSLFRGAVSGLSKVIDFGLMVRSLFLYDRVTYTRQNEIVALYVKVPASYIYMYIHTYRYMYLSIY